jgi:hypothetical protein
MYCFSCLVQFLLADLAGLIRVNNLRFVAAELGGVLLPKPSRHIVSLFRVAHHYKQHGFAL